MAVSTGAAIMGGASLLGGIMGKGAAKDAASAQIQAAQEAAAVQREMFQTTQKNLQPYMAGGNAALNQLMYLMGITPSGSYYSNMGPETAAPGVANTTASTFTPGTYDISTVNNLSPEHLAAIQTYRPDLLDSNAYQQNNLSTQGGKYGSNYELQRVDDINNFLAGVGALPGMNGSQGTGTSTDPNALNINPDLGGFGSLSKPIEMTQEFLESTPGYKFNLEQGMKAVNNSLASRGLSGAAMKGAARFATGLADNTYQNQFSNAVTNQTNQFNRLASLMGVGQSSAATQGNIGTQVASNIGSSLIGGGNAAAAGILGGNNALTGGMQSASNMYMLNQLMQGMYGGN